ncbi:AI-2E family transporter [Fulvivirga sp. M361]|uniref:AI-2E family transporter n=1 Tax=Fulvivirga sp. M361 TaxID=2594266 RepID=UPI00117ABBD0|nr:AI-2E family transporter [Fulvivirga sp. M361]TRX60496.1 AI-2E family transporter [Fulvivirga sp. M361]
MQIHFRKTFYIFACVAALLALIYLGKPILITMTMALLSSFILYPICSRLERWGLSRVVAALATLITIIGLTLGVFYLFSTQIISLMSEFTDFEHKLVTLFESVVNFINNRVALVPDINSTDIIDSTQEWVEESGGDIMTNTFNRTAALLSGVLAVTVYTFLLLIYRSGLKNVAVSAASLPNQEKTAKMLGEIQKVGQHYLVGMSIMIGILGTANSLILLVFGIDHAFFFGFLAALLAIIPYVGTTLGALIPVLYALMTHSSYWIPLGVMLAFWFIQLIESNYLSPKIVGGNLNINALAAIISLIVGGYLWGVAGMILFLPMTAILKVICGYFDDLKPVSMLLGNSLYEQDGLTQGKSKN